MGLILDSSVIIAHERRGLTVRQLLEQIQAIYGEVEIALSVVTIAELVHGAYRSRNDRERGTRLTFIEHLSKDVPVHPFTLQGARMVGRIEGERAAHGIAIGFEDLVIGVTALQLGFEIATLNVRHFERIPGLRIASP